MAKGLYKFYWDCGRMGELEGVFVAEDTDIESALDREVYFGEVLGKHSEIYGTLKSDDIRLLTTDETVIDIFEQHLGEVGYNPLEFLEE